MATNEMYVGDSDICNRFAKLEDTRVDSVKIGEYQQKPFL
jgi:hypothetical protein